MENGEFRISIDAALALLPEGEEVHTFLNPGGMLVGADWPRADVENAIRKYGGALLTGDLAQSMGHGLAVESAGRMLFIASKASK